MAVHFCCGKLPPDTRACNANGAVLICERARPPCNKCGIRSHRLCEWQSPRGIDYFHQLAEPVLASSDPLEEALVAKEPTVPKDIAGLSFEDALKELEG